MASSTESVRRVDLRQRATGIALPSWPAAAWASIATAALFVVASCWWLAHDESIPVFDAGMHLGYAIGVYERLSSGHVLRALTESAPYPPLTYLVGAVGIAVGGVGVAPAVLALNVVFVSLLALGCYKVGRMAFGPTAGLLAVLFALGSPLVIEEFHEFMVDAPEAAMVAIAVWGLLSSERFSRVGVSALAGAAVGLGMLTKETLVFFVAGVALVTAVRGGVRAWRGMAAFAAVALAIAGPWYVYEYSAIHALAHEALGAPSFQSLGIAPPRMSSANLEWYVWSLLNWQLFAPLFAVAAIGFIWTLAGFARRRPVSAFAAELALGAFVSWACLTETYVHDTRYGIPMTMYAAVLGVGWISRLPRRALTAVACALAVLAAANTLGVGFGVGPNVLVGPSSEAYEQQPGRMTLLANYGYWIGAPSRDGDLLGLLRALRHSGVRDVGWNSAQELEADFSYQGITVLAQIAGLRVPTQKPVEEARLGHSYAVLRHDITEANLGNPCIVLQDGTGVWVALGGSRGLEAWSYCPR
jgi:4-amino-4-deoxy-L-arabinose transferase-like glycosyltransferase